ncbi:HD-GYP domain-containing protein [Desulfatitalea alkaliphila]|uniref:HD domain-containing protein n=1 Tax=Desulfatitalea alkaliphila TaxID=2929485 RepID=A0AA41R5C5_9BACT|nr:HD domain-containing phosphohydrolase [Desulfatitalea alkaliphila]MCJ8501275.1 HD domain-containing protein [Desulfatitalea alkaliphila]
MHIVAVGLSTALAATSEKILTQWGHTVTAVTATRRALDTIAADGVDMVMAAYPLPDGQTNEFLTGLKEAANTRTPYLLLLTEGAAWPDGDSAYPVLDLHDVSAHPIDAALLRSKTALAERLSALGQDLDRKLLVIRRNYYQTVETLSRLIEAYDESVGAHCRRVGRLALHLAKRHPAVDAAAYPVVEAAGMLHDIGMVGLPAAVLKKRRTELAGSEGMLYRSHAERGEAVLGATDLLRPVARLVRSHHEQHNGRGFPDGLKGDRIPVGAAIVSAASLYDDLVHRERVDPKRVPEQLQRCRGYQLRPDLIGLLLEANLELMQKENQRVDRMVDIESLEAGMVLSREVLMKSGAFCMAPNTPLSEEIIKKLKHYYEMGNIANKVFVKK